MGEGPLNRIAERRSRNGQGGYINASTCTEKDTAGLRAGLPSG